MVTSSESVAQTLRCFQMIAITKQADLQDFQVVREQFE